MTDEPWYMRVEREAAEAVEQLISLRDMTCEFDHGDDVFDPWRLFPSVYGSYESAFDQLAIQVLNDIHCGVHHRRDLAARMFREMLCVLHLCDYGTSPWVCFATTQFKPLIPALIEKWKTYYEFTWGGEYVTDPTDI